MKIHKSIIISFALSVLSVCIVSCRQDIAVEQPVVNAPEGEAQEKAQLEVHLTMQQPVTKSLVSGEWSEMSPICCDIVSLSVSRLEEPIDSGMPETKGAAFLTSLPNRLWFNIEDEDDQVINMDYVERNGSVWLTGDGYFLNPAHEFDFYVSNFDPDLTSLNKSITPTTTFNDSVDGDDYYAYTRDDIVGHYFRQTNSTAGDYDVQMHHIYTAVFFEFSGVGPTGAVIQSVNLKNIKRSGTMSYSTTGVTWSATGSVSDLTNNVNYTIINGTSNNFSSICPLYVPASAITSTSALEVKMSYLGQVFTLTQSLAGDVWKAGYKYTYRFGFNGFTNSSNYTLVVSPVTATVNVGGTQTFTATLKLNYGGSSYTVPSNVSNVVWSSSSTSVASKVSNTAYSSGSTSAVFRGVSAGSSYIACQCSYGGTTYSSTSYPQSARLEVSDVVTYQYRLVLEPESLTIPIGSTGTFVAKLHTDRYVNGSLDQTDYNVETIPASSINWTFGGTNNNYVGMSSGSLTFTGYNVGSCNLQAFYNDSSRGISVADTSNPVTVVPAYRSVISPSSRTAMVNDVVRYDCYLQKQTTINGSWSNVTSGVTYSWSSRNTTYATVSGSATSQYAYFRALQANDANTSTIIDCTCTYENVAYPASTASLIITPEYSLSVSPSSATIPVGSYRSYTATLQKRSSVSASWTTITSGITGWSWYSSNTSVASISSSTSSATARGLSSGYSYIYATCTVDGISVWSDSYASILNVEDNYHLEVSPYSQSVGVGDTCYFTAELYNGTNYIADVTSSATWSFVSPSNASSYVINNTGGSFIGKAVYSSTITVQASYNYNGENLSGTGYITSVTSTTATFYRIVFSTSDSSVYYSDQYFSGFYVRKGGYGYLTPVLQQRTMVRTWQSGTTFTWVPASGSAGNWANSSTSISRSNCTWSTADGSIAWFTPADAGRINGSSTLSSYPAITTFKAVYNGTSIGNSGKNPDGTDIASDDTNIYVLRKGGSGNDNGENGS